MNVILKILYDNLNTIYETQFRYLDFWRTNFVLEHHAIRRWNNTELAHSTVWHESLK